MRIELKDENQEEPQKIDENDIRYKHETDLTKKEKRELEKMKLASMGWKGKLQYIWAYYKPQMAAIVAVIAILSFFHIDYDDYNVGGSFVSFLLTPATDCLAIPLYEQVELYRKRWESRTIHMKSSQ